MPASSIRDLVIHDDDVVVGTHGRSFWILDDITPLRQIDEHAATAEAHLFKPQVAYRVRWNLNPDTPLPPEEPAGKNPPDGAILNYYLKVEATGPVILEILDQQNQLVRRYTNTDKPEPVMEKDLDIPTYWIRPPQTPPAKAGSHRFIWDLHYPPPAGAPRTYPLAAIYRDTPGMPQGPAVLPGQYTVRLMVDGRSFSQPLTVKMDPRVKTPPEGLAQQFALSMQSYRGMGEVHQSMEQVRKLRAQLKERQERAGQGALAEALRALDQKAAALIGEGSSRRQRLPGSRRPGKSESFTLIRAYGELSTLLETLEGADATPTTQVVAACGQVHQALFDLQARWGELKNRDVKSLNEQLAQTGLARLSLGP